MRPRFSLSLSLLMASWLATMAAQSARLAAIPTVSPNEFPSEVRGQLQQAYDAARQHPLSAQAVGRLGMLLHLYNHPDQALECYERASALAPRAFEWPYYEALLLARRKQYAVAAERLRQALRIEPDYLPARLRLAESLLNAGDAEESEKIYASLVKEYPDSAEAHYGMGRIWAARGDAAQAARDFEKACQLFPAYGAAHYALAQAYGKLGKAAQAEEQRKLYEGARSIVPPVEDPRHDALRALDQSSTALLERGVALEKVGRVDDAIRTTERAAQLNPGLVQAHLNLMILYGRRGDFARAEQHFRAAMALNSTRFPTAYYDYGVLMMNEGKPAEAEKAFEKAAEIDPQYAEAHNNLGYLLERQGKLAEASKEYRQAVEARPAFAKAHFNLGRILVNQGDYQDGIQQLKLALDASEQNAPEYLYALGAAYGRSGDTPKALEYLKKARDQAAAGGKKALAGDIEKDMARLRAH
jgi:tetratricopeptide (TPR) repeat protein